MMSDVSVFLQSRFGELAALGAAMCWVFTSLTFAAAGRRIGSVAVNLIRILLAMVILGCVHRVLLGIWIPRLDGVTVWYLGLSGLVGLAIGDQFLFTALVDVGSRLATLLMTLGPPVAAMLAWPILDEPLGWLAMSGIAVTIIGIGWAVMERSEGAQPRVHRHRMRGTIFGVLAGICQAIGLVLAKLGIGHTRLEEAQFVSPLTATLVRMSFAAVGICLMAGVLRLMLRKRSARVIDVSPETEHIPAPLDEAKRSKQWKVAIGLVLIGTILGPVAGVWLSLIAVDLTDTGIAATLMAMSPVFILPFAAWLEKEHLSWRAVIGALVAVGGVVLLTIQDSDQSMPPVDDPEIQTRASMTQEPDA